MNSQPYFGGLPTGVSSVKIIEIGCSFFKKYLLKFFNKFEVEC